MTMTLSKRLDSGRTIAMVLAAVCGVGGWAVGEAAGRCPPAPVVAANALGSCSVNLNWTPIPQALSFEVERSSTMDFSTVEQIGVVPAGAVGFADTAPVPDQVNYYRVRGRVVPLVGVCPGGFGPYSAVVSATPAANIAAPTNLAVSMSCDYFRLTWDPVPGAAWYAVRWELGSTSTNATVTQTRADLFTGNASGTFTFVVTPFNNCGPGPSAVRTLPFNGALQTPGAVFNISASRAVGGGVAVRWTPPVRSESQLLRRRDTATGAITASWTLGASDGGFLDFAAPTDVPLSYSVAGVNAVCGEGVALWSPAATATPIGVLVAPTPLRRSLNQTAVFTAVFSQLPAGASLRWRKDGVNVSNSARISGATTASLTIGGLLESDEGAYDLLVTGPGLMPLSLPTSLVITSPCRADYNASGVADIDDIFVFLNDWFAGCP
jgi:hypothetical protein